MFVVADVDVERCSVDAVRASSYSNTMTSRKIKQQQVTSSYLSMSSPSQQSLLNKQGSSAVQLGNLGTSAPPHIAAMDTSLKTPPNNNSPHFTDMHGGFHSLQQVPTGGHASSPSQPPPGNQFHSLQHPNRSNNVPVVNFNIHIYSKHVI